MAVGLFTSRLVLGAMGVVDYGVYGLVGGIVTMFSFLNSAMTSATQRYLSFDIGKGETDRLQKTFNASLNIHYLIALLILILAETIGLWFVNHKLNLPAERMEAINWIYQLSILTFLLEVIQVPYNALLIAHEHMSIYAYLSILEAVLKLVAVFILIKTETDKLVLYAVLIFCVTFIIRMFYKLYCKRHFKESVYRFYYNKKFYRELLSFSGWNLFGNIAVIARGQGSNILLNLFFGPVANAAYSLVNIVQGTIINFVSNFQIAVNPRITKYYARGEVQSSLKLIFLSSRFSFFAMLLLVLPLLFNIEFILHLWLGKVPTYTVSFLRLALLYALIETISNPLIMGAQATGRIKWYQIIVGTFIFLTLPISWVVLKVTHDAVNLYWVLIINSCGALMFRIIFLQKMIGLNIKAFLTNVVIRILVVALPLFAAGEMLRRFGAQNIANLVLQSIIICVITITMVIIFGTTKNERATLINSLELKIKPNKRREQGRIILGKTV